MVLMQVLLGSDVETSFNSVKLATAYSWLYVINTACRNIANVQFGLQSEAQTYVTPGSQSLSREVYPFMLTKE